MEVIPFTTETLRTRRNECFVCREIPTDKTLLPVQGCLRPKAREIMENRHLPILHKEIFSPCSPCLERVLQMKDEWVVE